MYALSQLEETVVTPKKETRVLPPWKIGPRHLVSWWDMQKFGAEVYVNVAGNLAAMAQHFALNNAPFSQSNRKLFSRQLGERATECRAIGLEITARQFEAASENIEELSPQEQFLSIQAATMIVDLQNAMMCEMKSQLFLWVQADKAKYYEQSQLFGNKVANRFLITDKDIRVAGNCYAADNNTACVFHCMRVLEKGLHEFADHLGIPFKVPVELQNWQNIIEPIETEIHHRELTLPRGTAKSEELQSLSAAAAQFRYFKEAWRNHVAHARVDYDDIDALRIMNHVHQFMEALVDVI